MLPTVRPRIEQGEVVSMQRLDHTDEIKYINQVFKEILALNPGQAPAILSCREKREGYFNKVTYENGNLNDLFLCLQIPYQPFNRNERETNSDNLTKVLTTIINIVTDRLSNLEGDAERNLPESQQKNIAKLQKTIQRFFTDVNEKNLKKVLRTEGIIDLRVALRLTEDSDRYEMLMELGRVIN